MCSLWYLYTLVPVFIGFYIIEYKSDILHLLKYKSFIGIEDEFNVVDLLIYVPSSRNNLKERNAIRTSWWSYVQHNNTSVNKSIILKFVLGKWDCLTPEDYRVDPFSCEEWILPGVNEVNNQTKKVVGSKEYVLNPNVAVNSNDDIDDGFVDDHVHAIQSITFIVHHPILLTKLGVHDACRSAKSIAKLLEATTKKEIVSIWFPSKPSAFSSSVNQHLSVDKLGNTTMFKFKKLADPLILPKGFRGEVVVDNMESGNTQCVFPKWNFPMQTYLQSHNVVQFIEPKMHSHETYMNVERWNTRPAHLINFAFKFLDTDQLIEKIKMRDLRHEETAYNSTKLDQQLKRESDKFKDVLFVDIVDVYRHLPHKFLAFAKWASLNMKFEFLLKTDDDCYVDIEKIINKLRTLFDNHSILLGRLRHNWPVDRWGRWAELSYTSPVYPRFPCGSGYVMSYDLVHWIGINHMYLQPYQGEDVSIGIWLSTIKHTIIDEPLWQCENECLSDMYSMPDLHAEQLQKHWNNKILCGDPCGCD